MKLLFVSLLFMIITACWSAPVNQSAILSAYSKIDVSDGVNEDEMKVIAQRFLLVTSDEPCKSDLSNVRIGDPHKKCGWGAYNDHGCYIGFSKKSIFEITPLYIKVSEVTGEAWCAGYLILK